VEVNDFLLLINFVSLPLKDYLNYICIYKYNIIVYLRNTGACVVYVGKRNIALIRFLENLLLVSNELKRILWFRVESTSVAKCYGIL
jgi:hypothetical protein